MWLVILGGIVRGLRSMRSEWLVDGKLVECIEEKGEVRGIYGRAYGRRAVGRADI